MHEGIEAGGLVRSHSLDQSSSNRGGNRPGAGGEHGLPETLHYDPLLGGPVRRPDRASVDHHSRLRQVRRGNAYTCGPTRTGTASCDFRAR